MLTKPQNALGSMSRSTTFMNRLIEGLGMHLLHHHFLPMLLALVAMSGFCFIMIVGLPGELFKIHKAIEIVLAFSLVGMAFGGTALSIILIKAFSRRESLWKLFGLGRFAWISLVSLAWLMGAACGGYLVYIHSP
jgi:hypothetical protein